MLQLQTDHRLADERIATLGGRFPDKSMSCVPFLFPNSRDTAYKNVASTTCQTLASVKAEPHSDWIEPIWHSIIILDCKRLTSVILARIL